MRILPIIHLKTEPKNKCFEVLKCTCLALQKSYIKDYKTLNSSSAMQYLEKKNVLTFISDIKYV